MLSSMTPVIVNDSEGDPLLVTGSPGGRTIINTVACTVLNVLEFECRPLSADRGARMHHAWFPDRIQVEAGLLNGHAESIDELKRMGHIGWPDAVKQGNAHTISIDPQTRVIHGIADSRAAAPRRGMRTRP